MPARGSTQAPEQRLTAKRIAELTGLHKYTVLRYMKPGGPLHNGVARLGKAMSVPASTYAAWVENQRLDVVL